MSATTTINFQANVPFPIGTNVYRKADLAVLKEHKAYFNSLQRYRVVGYEFSVVMDENCDNKELLTCTTGNAIIQTIRIGNYEQVMDGFVYCHPDLLQEATQEIDKAIESINNLF